jgi:DNA-binding CsgD family transcriptional regulator
LSWSGSELGRAEGYLGWARWHYANRDPGQAREHARMAVAAATDPAQPLVLLGGWRLIGVINLDSGHIEEARNCLEDALAMAATCDAPLEQALTMLDLARLHRTAGKTHQVSVLLDQVEAIATKMGAQMLHDQVANLRGDQSRSRPAESNASGLTARELEVLGLLGRGMTDKEIAAALFISPYTASTHVKHLLTKLDVANRRAAALVAHELGAT